jgi:hypothetical protein
MDKRWEKSVKRFIGKTAMVTDHDGNKFFGVIDAILYNYGKVVLIEEEGMKKEINAIYINNVANIRIVKEDYLEDKGETVNTVIVKINEKEFADGVCC